MRAGPSLLSDTRAALTTRTSALELFMTKLAAISPRPEAS